MHQFDMHQFNVHQFNMHQFDIHQLDKTSPRAPYARAAASPK